MKLKYLLGISALALGATALTSCNDDNYDVVGNPDNLVFMSMAVGAPAEMPQNTYTYNLFYTPVGPKLQSAPGDVEFYVQCTKPAPQDITVSLEIDPTATVVGYDVIPENSGLVVTLDQNTVVIPKGETRSTIAIATVDDTNVDWTKFDGDLYLLPVKVKNITGGAVASKQFPPVAYVGVKVEHVGMVDPSSDGVVGNRVSDCSAWTGTWEAPNAGNAPTALNIGALTDQNNWSYAFFRSNHADKCNEEVIVNLDLGEVKTLKGMMVQYYYYWYTVKDLTLETSVDGVNYRNEGSRTWDNNSYTRYVNFWEPFEVRYIRFTTHSFYGGTGEGTALADINVYE